MNIPLSPEKMTVSEKLATIELLWDDLCRFSSDVPSPGWHGKILAERESKIASGIASFTELSDVKEQIRKEIQ